MSGLGGAAPYWTDYTYDSNGLRTGSVAHAAAGSTTSTYAYPAAGASQPHAVSSVTATGPSGTSTSSYAYDKAGNTTTRSVAGQASQTLTWSEEGKLATVTAGGTQVEANVYTADGDRLIRRAGGKVTAYLPGGQELTLDTSSQTLSAVRYYTFAGKTIAMRTGTGFAPVSTMVPDNQGTAVETVANTTSVTTRRWTDPFGGSRGTPTGAWTGDRGFLNKVTDATGLTAVGARFYDPSIGRFVSVDPVMDGSDPQQWAAYTYSDNNPVTLSDPTGVWPNWGKAWNTVTSKASAAGRWINKHQAQIAGAVAGVVVGVGCSIAAPEAVVDSRLRVRGWRGRQRCHELVGEQGDPRAAVLVEVAAGGRRGRRGGRRCDGRARQVRVSAAVEGRQRGRWCCQDRAVQSRTRGPPGRHGCGPGGEQRCTRRTTLRAARCRRARS